MATIFTSVSAISQNISKDVLGIKLSNSDGLFKEFSWQHKLEDTKRIEIGLGFDAHSTSISGIYQWVKPLKGDFNWYLGAGPMVNKVVHNYSLFAVGNVGIEYDFKFPLQLSIDIRPSVELLGDFLDYKNTPLSLGARYRF